MLNLLTRYRHISVFVLCVFISLTLLSLNRPADTLLKPSNVLERTMLFLLQPFQSMTSNAIGRIQNVWAHYIALVHLYEENQDLRKELQRAQAEKNLYIEKALAYDRLKDTLNLMEERQFTTILARVIGYDSTNQTHTVTINKGSDDGVRESWPVITQDGIAGITVSVSQTSSKVLLLIDPNCNVAALIQRTRDQGIVSGQPKNETYIMKYVSTRATIREGTTYQITETSLAELARVGLPGFRITEPILPRLQEAGVPADTLLILEDLQDLLYVSQSSFIQALEATIGREQADWYIPIFLQHARADLLARLQQIKDRTFLTERDFLAALPPLIGEEQTARFKDQILLYAREEEMVVSSGLGGIFPKGLRIGTVSKVLRQEYNPFQDIVQNIEIIPSVNFSKLEEVLIIRRDVAEPMP